jgi:hypothetical protein
MTDHGHPLQFGTFVTPTNADPQAPVRLGILADELGYDLVTYQDHPYQAGFHDTWTLLSWVAARTERIRVSANVTNLPLRPPAVLARAAASLDLLSAGRFDLGLGSGAFWDAIEAMGGRRLTPGQGVQALDEAIDIIRGIWDGNNRAPLRTEGEFHRVNGAKRGPLPAHPIPINIGAYKPRMLRLVGRKADGWLPSLSYMQPAELTNANRTIDDAAGTAGRGPAEIRRMLNINGTFTARRNGMLQGPAEQWVEQLLPLVIDEGFATFILGTDDPSTTRHFIEEVAPALREAVTAERHLTGTPTLTGRSRAAISQRRTGIDYDRIPAALAETAVEPGDFHYPQARSTYLRGGTPGLVLRPKDSTEVADAVRYASAQPVALAIRSGGHGISGRSTNDGGIVIDVGALNTIEVIDASSRLVRIGPGARWQNVAAELDAHGWALSSGDYGGVGVGGLATAGGIGFLARQHGLTIDHLRAVEIVLADGTVTRADETTNPDLFWAVRGAGANFGIVTAFEFEVVEIGEVGWAQLAFDVDDTRVFLQQWAEIMLAAPRDTTAFLNLGRARGGRQLAQMSALINAGDEGTIIDRLQPFAALAPLVEQSVYLTRYSAVMANSSNEPHQGRGEPHSRSGLVDVFTDEFAAAASDLLNSGAVHFFQIRTVGSAVADIDPDATAYGYRTANFSVVAFGPNRDQLDAAWDRLRPLFNGSYLSFDSSTRPDRIADAFPAPTLARLQALKQRFDPANVFRDNFNIAIDGTTAQQG